MAINKTTDEQRTRIRRATVLQMPDRPSERGLRAQDIKDALSKPICGDQNSVLAELDRVVEEANEELEHLEEEIANIDLDAAAMAAALNQAETVTPASDTELASIVAQSIAMTPEISVGSTPAVSIHLGATDGKIHFSFVVPKGDTGPTGQTGANGQDGIDGEDGQNGATFTPSISNAGVLSFTNDGGLPNPPSVDIAAAVIASIAPIKVTNASPSFVADNTYLDYGYKGTITVQGATSNMRPEVIFGNDEVLSGNYAAICESGTDCVYIYAKVNTAITIPVVLVHRT